MSNGAVSDAAVGPSRVDPWLAVGALITLGIVFAAEAVTPLGFAHGFLYLPVVLLGLFHSDIRLGRFVVVLAVIAAWAGMLISPAPPADMAFGYVIGNRIGATLALATAWFVRERQRRERLDRHEEIRRRLDFEALAEALPVQIWTATPDGHINYVGQRLSELTGLDAETICADWTQILHPDDREQTVARWREAIATRSQYQTEFRLCYVDGRFIWHRAEALPEFDANGEVRRWLGSTIDIEDLVAVREEAERLSWRYRQTVESITDAFFTLDADFRFSYVNARAAEILGQTRERLLGGTIWEDCELGYESVFARHYRQAVREQCPVHFEAFFAPRAVWLDVRAYPSAEGLTVYFLDVTRQREEAQELRLLRSAVERINDIILITEAEPVDEPGPRIVFVNDAFEQRTGYDREAVIGHTPRLLQGPDTDRVELDRIHNALSAWEPVRAELLNYTREGTPLWLEVDIVPLPDENGRYTHWVAAERDITDRKTAEASLKLSDERFRLLARATNDVIWDWDLVNQLVWWNDNLQTLFGHDPETVEPGPESWKRRIHPEDRERVVAGIHTAIEGTDDHWTDEYRFLRSDGSSGLVRDRGFIIRDEAGTAIRMLGSMADITEYRELEERIRQSQKLEAVGHLTGGVAHDFNNLLTVIVGNADMLVEELEGNDDLRPLAELTQAAAQRGAELTNRLLAFSRKQALDPQTADVNRLLAHMKGLLRRTLPENIEMEVVKGKDTWPAEIDIGQFELAILNLAVNARDAMPDGGRLTIETGNANLDVGYADRHAELEAGHYVRIAISDTGCGMDAETTEHALEPFFTTKGVGRGSGLGLSMVYGFVKQSGGHLNIYSEPGEGTTINLYFPRAQDTNAGSEGEAVKSLPPEGGDACILVVEDDDLVRQHVETRLRSLGYVVYSAGSGPEALERLAEIPRVDVLFTDVIMPGGMNGREVAEKAASLCPGLRILFTSGYTENAIVHHGRLDPGVQLLTKPYNTSELADKIREVLAT